MEEEDMETVTKKQAIETVENYILKSQDGGKVDKCRDILAKLNSLSEEEFNKIVYRNLGENADLIAFNNWLTAKLQEPDLQGTKFVQLNDFVSYNLAGISKDTIALHVVPTQVTNKQIRNSGAYLVDALEQLKTKIKNGEFEEVETIFAVSDILKLKKLQEYFRELGFDVGEGEEMFRGRFKNPYQASLSKEFLMNEDWERLKEQFMRGKPTIADIEKAIEQGSVSRQLSDAQNIQEIDINKKQILQNQREIYQGDLEKEDNNGDIKNINIDELSYEELEKLCFHYSLKKDKNSIQRTGLSARIGRNSDGIDKFKSIYFSYGVEAVLETWDVWLKWRANRLYNPYWQEENKDIQQAIENGTATEQEKREFYHKCQKWNEDFASGKYKEDTEKIRFLYDFQIDEMLASNYYILDLKEGEDFTFDEIDVKKAPFINMDRNNIRYKISSHMLGNYTDFESAKVDKWNMNTVLGKELTIKPTRIKQVKLDSGKNDVLSIVTILYDKYKESTPKEKQVQFDLLDGYMDFVRDRIKNNELPHFNRNDRIDEHDLLAYFHSQKTENDFKDGTVSFGFTEQEIGKETVLKSKGTIPESAQEEIKSKRRTESDIRDVETTKEVDDTQVE